jgi:hypothetical protein
MASLVFLCAGAAAGALSWWNIRRRLGRDRALMLLCARAGVEFAPVDPFQDLWLPFRLFGQGTERGTCNAVWQSSDQGAVHAFEFWYRGDPVGRRRAETVRLTCAAVKLPTTCPQLTVEPRDTVDVVEDAVAMERIELELEVFNRRFEVRAADRRFAVAFLDQRMMHALMMLPSEASILVNDDTMLVHAPALPAADVLLLLDAARQVQQHVPRVLASLYPPEPEKGPHEDRWLAGHWTPEPTGEGPLVSPEYPG